MASHDDSLLQDLLDERLDAASAAAVRERLDSEPALREAWDELRRIRDLVRGTTADRAPPDFLTRVRAGIEASGPTPDTVPDAVPDAVFDTVLDTVPDAVPDAAAPAGRRLVFPRRLAVAASGLAALFLVALGVRWMVAGDAPIPGSPRVLESARAPEHLETGDLVREGLPAGGAAADGVVAGERERAGGVLPRPVTTPDARTPAAVAAGAAAPSAPAGSTAGPVPPPPATGPAPARDAGFQPGDQVPTRLRTPTDDRAVRDELERAAGDRRGAREEKSAATARTGAPALPTWTLEADDLASGRARLALLVGGLDAPSLAGDGLRLGAAGPDDLVLGSVVLCLPAARFAALAPAGSDGGPGAEARTGVDGGEAPDDTPHAKARSAPADAPGKLAEADAESPAAEAPDAPAPMPCAPRRDEAARKADGSTGVAYQVRVVLVRGGGSPARQPR